VDRSTVCRLSHSATVTLGARSTSRTCLSGFSDRRLDRNGLPGEIGGRGGNRTLICWLQASGPPVERLPQLDATLARRAQSLNVERDLADPVVGVNSIVEERLRCFGFALNFPDSCIRHVVRFLLEWRDKCRAEPLDSIVRLSREVAVVECDEMSALVSAVSGFFGILALTPIQSEHVLATLPRPILELDADAGILKPLERSHCDLVTEAVPELKPVERLHRGTRFMAKRVERQSPDHSTVLRQNVKAQRASMNGRGAKDADIN
jgi:hypothetical protein